MPFEQSVLMDKELERHGVRHELIAMPGRGHAFDRAMSDPLIAATFDRVLTFLEGPLQPQRAADRSQRSGYCGRSILGCDGTIEWARPEQNQENHIDYSMPNGRSGGFLIRREQLETLLRALPSETVIGTAIGTTVTVGQALILVAKHPQEQIAIEEQDHTWYIIRLSTWISADATTEIYSHLRECHAQWLEKLPRPDITDESAGKTNTLPATPRLDVAELEDLELLRTKEGVDVFRDKTTGKELHVGRTLEGASEPLPCCPQGSVRHLRDLDHVYQFDFDLFECVLCSRRWVWAWREGVGGWHDVTAEDAARMLTTSEAEVRTFMKRWARDEFD